MMKLRIALVSAALLTLGVTGCSDPQAEAKADAEAKAAKDKKAAQRKMRAGVDSNVRCLNAIRWQQPALSSAGIGAVSAYSDYYRERLLTSLGSETISEPPAPALTSATVDAYLDWSYPKQVTEVFTAGADGN